MRDGHVTTSIRGVISRVTTPGHLISRTRRPQRTFHPSVSFRVLSRAYPCSTVMVRGLGSAWAIRLLTGRDPRGGRARRTHLLSSFQNRPPARAATRHIVRLRVTPTLPLESRSLCVNSDRRAGS